MANVTTSPNVTSVAKSGSTKLNGDVTLTGGTNVTLTQSGQDISIAATGGIGTGDVVGPTGATDNAIARYDGITGKLIQDSVVTIADTTGNVAGLGTLNTHTLPGGTDTIALINATQTLAGKTLTAAKIANAGFIADANGNEEIIFTTTASAVNEMTFNNAATGGVPGFQATGGDANIHAQFIGKGNGLTKISVLQQLNTTDGYKHNSVILTGWGIYAQSAVANKSETVTFGITFASRPIVLVSYGGDSAAANTSYGSGANTVKGPVCIKAHTIATGSFIAQIHTSDGTSWGATDNAFYQWIAIGEL